MPTAEGPVPESPHAARIISSDSVPAGGFTPGTILADRYRIIGLLGRGGMGEVYRADDLKLGQPVALKFLPPKLAQDSVRRERFFAEVRITRQLSHPNICRVYDTQETDGRHFLSMEYIDGEDLASLIKRIGHLTNEKALDIARQLAAGLAAAHERGVLHRDLKPANIMLDGHGRVRITDFGLAIAAEEAADAAEIAGTPAYMAPEQLAGKGATVRSDIYSLGLVLYEIYTGKKAFTATTIAELREQKETHTPRAISELREGMDPVVERLIRRCMERDPNARPSSVAQLALALPGGDPLAAAIAAGETPSPEMVAASGGREGLRPAVAWGILAFIIVGILAIMATNDRFLLQRLIPFEKSPEILAERCQELIKKLGYLEKAKDKAYGFRINTSLLNFIEKSNKPADLWKNLGSKAMLFGYRQSPRRLEQPALMTSIGYNNPPLQFSGEILVMLDTEGRLVSLRAVPPEGQSSAKVAPATDWTILFSEAALDPSQWKSADTPWNPLFYADAKAAWQGSLPNQPSIPVRIEAAALQGKPVFFGITGPWSRTTSIRSLPEQLDQSVSIKDGAVLLLIVISIVGGLFFARRNLRLGRGDRRIAARLALLGSGSHLVMCISFLPRTSLVDFGLIPCVGGLFWILYIAIEPFVRRRWPQVLVSWTRLLSGDWRDPLVARDALVGCAFGVLVLCISRSLKWLPVYGDRDPIVPTLLSSLTGTLSIFPILLGLLAAITFVVLGQVFLLIALRLLLRGQKVTIAAFIILLSFLFMPGNLWFYPKALAIGACLTFLLMRFGLAASVFCGWFCVVLVMVPTTLDASAWYSRSGYLALAIFAAIVLYAFRTSLGGRPLLAPSRLDD
jgi:predicted Ser/Thr protein kinase